MILEISSALMSIVVYVALVNASFIFSSWRFTLPSYTTLPIRVTTPPRIGGVHAGRHGDRAPGARRDRALDRLRRVGGQRHRARHLGLDDVLQVHQAAAILVEQVGQQHQAIAPGQQPEQLAEDRVNRRPREQRVDERRLALRRDRRVDQHPRQLRVAVRQRHERLQVALDGLRDRPPSGSRRAAPSRSVRRNCGWSRPMPSSADGSRPAAAHA